MEAGHGAKNSSDDRVELKKPVEDVIEGLGEMTDVSGAGGRKLSGNNAKGWSNDFLSDYMRKQKKSMVEAKKLARRSPLM